MATTSFSKDFAITKRETVERLEEAIKKVRPLNIESKNVIDDMKENEGELLSLK